MLFDKNGEVVSYDESDIFCDDLMRADEHIDPSFLLYKLCRNTERKIKENTR